jgi:hypothetical protein
MLNEKVKNPNYIDKIKGGLGGAGCWVRVHRILKIKAHFFFVYTYYHYYAYYKDVNFF